jgi:integrase/recombinase XerD
MILQTVLDDYLYALGNKAANTRIGAKRLLRQFNEWCTNQDITDLDQIKAVTVRKYTEHLRSRGLADNSLQTHIRRLKAFLNWCVREDDYSISEKMVGNIEIPTVEKKILSVITDEMLDKLCAACAGSRYERRNRAIMNLLYGTGIRISELCNLTIDQVHMDADENYVAVFGKGRKWREVPFGDRTRKAMRAYLNHRHADKNEQHVFISYQKCPLTVTGVEQMLHQVADKAGIPGIHPHLFRHSYAVNSLRRGVDLYVLSRLLGHESVMVTQHYLRAFQASDARKNAFLF